jgi:uncharacterized sulfatase
LWTRYANFKGNTGQSLNDAYASLVQSLKESKARPQFTFINLMETHLPYLPPQNFIDEYAPYFKEDREVRDFMRNYNFQAFRWALPIEDRLKQRESTVLNDIYDAEVHYQDHLLAQVLELLNRPEVAERTLTIIVGDHGEGLGEHNFMGHSFVAYQELVHVPLMIRFPTGLGQGQRVKSTVSTRRLFHTVLEAAGIQLFESENRPATDVKQLSLGRSVQGKDPENELAFVEAYAPNNFLAMLETHVPKLIDTYYCNLNRRAVVQEQQKLVRIDGVQDELFDLVTDPGEKEDIIAGQPETAAKLKAKLDAFMARAIARRPDTWQAHQTLDLEEDENLLNQLRGLGYIE